MPIRGKSAPPKPAHYKKLQTDVQPLNPPPAIPLVKLSHPKYRPDIDGLRAIAVLSVVGFHAFPAWIPGGFIGVDIFFVISGYLISTIILENLEQNHFSYLQFYSRRIRRIFPALLTVLSSCLAFGWYVLLSDEFAQLGRHVIGGVGFVSNLMLWHESGYFDSASENKPLLHLWSLGIEEQFYIIWPLLLWLAYKRHWNYLVIMMSVGIASFALNIATINSNSVAAFYSPLSRFWELLIGSTLAYVTLYRKSFFTHHINPYAQYQSALGIILITIGLVTINKYQSFPGWWALLPTLGAALLIAAGAHQKTWVSHKLLSNRILVWVGLISFPLYLWHWPLLSFAKILNLDGPREVRAIIVIASVALATLTYQIIEKPLRFGKYGRLKTIGLIALALLVGVIGVQANFGQWSPRLNNPNLQKLVAARNDWEFPNHLKIFKPHDAAIYYIGDRSANATVFYGNSHMQQYSPRIVKIYSESKDKLNTPFFITAGTCPPIPNIQLLADKTRCGALNDLALNFIKSDQVKTVVIGSCWNCDFISRDHPLKGAVAPNNIFYMNNGIYEDISYDPGKTHALEELEKFLKYLGKSKKVYLLLDNPASNDFDPSKYFTGSRLSNFDIQNNISKSIKISQEEIQLNSTLVAIARRANVDILDPTKKICIVDNCYYIDSNGLPIYNDSNHLRSSFIRENGDFMDPTLKQ